MNSHYGSNESRMNPEWIPNKSRMNPELNIDTKKRIKKEDLEQSYRIEILDSNVISNSDY